MMIASQDGTEDRVNMCHDHVKDATIDMMLNNGITISDMQYQTM